MAGCGVWAGGWRGGCGVLREDSGCQGHVRVAHSQCYGLLGHQLTDGESIWNDKKCHFTNKASVRLPEGFHCSSRPNVPCPTATVRTVTGPLLCGLW